MKRVAALFLLLLVSACSQEDNASKTSVLSAGDDDARPLESQTLFDLQRVARGARLYQENCAQCHGPQAQGHPDWQRARKAGFAAAPPLNGTGTDVTLTQSAMVSVIRKGARHNGVMVMPAWRGRVSDEQILDIISWYQALWPAETYQAWRSTNVPATKTGSRGRG